MKRNEQKTRHPIIAQFICLFAMAVTLCGCVDGEVNKETAPTDLPTQTTSQLETTYEVTETTQITTEPTEIVTELTTPQHSDLFLPSCTTQQMVDYFSEVVLDIEYSSGDGDFTLVQKWTTPIFYRIYGTPTEEDSAVLNGLFTQLNEIQGFPGIYAAEDGASENLSLSFLDNETFNQSFSEVINGEYAFGAVQFWYYTDTNDIYTARIGYRTDLDQVSRNSVLQEEIVNALGISDTLLREDSIVYQYSDENTSLSDVDLVILKLLYHPDIRCGMNSEECRAVIEKLYY